MLIPKRDDAQMLGEVHPVDHQRHQVQPGEILADQLAQRPSRSSPRTSRHRRLLDDPDGAGLDLLADRLQAAPGNGGSRARPASAPSPSCRAAPSRRTAHRPAPPPRRCHRRHEPGAGHRHPAATQHHRPGPGAVPGRRAVRVGLPRGPHAALTSVSISCSHHLQPGTDRERQQPLTHVGGDLVHRDAHLPGHGQQFVSTRSSGTSCSWWSPVSLGRLWRTPNTYRRQASGGGPPPQIPRVPGQPPLTPGDYS